ncbi:MAG: hypothetical protein JW803_02125 [Endomicrobiales bacterium]|nr:hypothetical protein [Endomicrobiales bacterium]
MKKPLEKVFLILLGLVLSLAVIEAGIRVAGFAVLKSQERQNRIRLKNKSDCRILCVGESTTQREWPPMLQKVLDERSRGVRYTVIDCGLGGTNTSFISAMFERQYEEYRPDIVVAMMGINDDKVYEPRIDTDGSGNGLDLKVVSLCGLAAEHAKCKYRELAMKLKETRKKKGKGKKSAVKQKKLRRILTKEALRAKSFLTNCTNPAG